MPMTVTRIFDRTARRLRRDRLARATTSPFEAHVAQLLEERLDSVNRSFERALVINCGSGATSRMLAGRGIAVINVDVGARFAAAAGGIQCDEDALPRFDAAFDLVCSPVGLDTVDDLPGALILARRALLPDGLFLACFPTAPSLGVLRRASAAADGERAFARFHPQIDLRGAGDLLVRAGFALPVADGETITLAYRTLATLIDDLRKAGATNLLVERQGVSRSWLDRATQAFAAAADDEGRTIETITLATLTGWSPAASQPVAAKRGSATMRLDEALRQDRPKS